MDLKKWIIEKKYWWLGGTGILLLAGISLWIGFQSQYSSKSEKQQVSTEEHPSPKKQEKGVFHTIHEAVQSVDAKVKKLKELDLENRRLKAENAALKSWIQKKQFQCQVKKAEAKTENLSKELQEKTDSSIGRTLASIHYRIPKHLNHDQLYTLAIAYFEKKELEKAAVILSYLTRLKEDSSFQKPKDLLLTGIIWYRLEHYKNADQYFDRVMSYKGKANKSGYLPQAYLWKAIVADQKNQKDTSQKWLKRLLNRYPYSREAKWVNPALTKENET